MPIIVKKTKCLDKIKRLGFTSTCVTKTIDFKEFNKLVYMKLVNTILLRNKGPRALKRSIFLETTNHNRKGSV